MTNDSTPKRHQYVGLNEDSVERSRAEYGRNVLSPPERESLWHKFIEKFRDPIIIILLVAMVLSFVVALYHYMSDMDGANVFFEPLGVLLAVVLATGIAFYFELKSEREFELLNEVNDEVYYKVYRSGYLTEVLRADIVVGDIIELETGEEIPADGTLLESISLSVNESSLTGEPMVQKTTREADYDGDATYPSNYICRGTTILDGHCIYRVDKVGDATEYGRVFEGAQMDDSVETPLNRQLGRLATIITRVSYAIASLVLIGSVVMYVVDGGFDQFDWSHAMSYFLERIMIAVTVIVVAVPEGLPMSVTLSLAYSMRSMMRTNNLVRRMHACETMGAATVICTDKTGTLTQNKMTVGDYSTGNDVPLTDTIYMGVAHNTTAHLERSVSSADSFKVLGNPTEGALLLWLNQQGIDYTALRLSGEVEEQLPFNTERKFMATVVRINQKRMLFIKGAPEIVMTYCQIDPIRREALEVQLVKYQDQAMRTIGMASCQLEDGKVAFVDGRLAVESLNFEVVFGISDPIRVDVPQAIERCMQAGISVKIVTGDTPGTAMEIGRQIGLWAESCTRERKLITGVEFEALSDEELRPRISDIHIMSRARPMDKERLVRLLQEAGEVVAVTGDGTNDAPALNRAHVGLSMGDGTSVAKEASDITILDNSFASITQAVLWGRSLYLNIQRFILFQMTINVVACLIVLIGAFLGTESPLTVTQMLWVNLIMDTFAALALASLPPREEVMCDKPRRQTDSIVSRAMVQRIFGLGTIFIVILFALVQYYKLVEVRHLSEFSFADMIGSFFNFTSVYGGLSAYELTTIFCIFVFLQFWNMFNAKAYHTTHSALSSLEKCRGFLMISGIIVLGQIAITTFGGKMFRVVPLDLSTWLIIISATSVVLLLGEIVRLSTRR